MKGSKKLRERTRSSISTNKDGDGHSTVQQRKTKMASKKHEYKYRCRVTQSAKITGHTEKRT